MQRARLQPPSGNDRAAAEDAARVDPVDGDRRADAHDARGAARERERGERACEAVDTDLRRLGDVGRERKGVAAVEAEDARAACRAQRLLERLAEAVDAADDDRVGRDGRSTRPTHSATSRVSSFERRRWSLQSGAVRAASPE